MKLYDHRMPFKLEPYYSRHVAAMTSEGLHAKSDIAAELAWRDQRCQRLEDALAIGADKWKAKHQRVKELEEALARANSLLAEASDDVNRLTDKISSLEDALEAGRERDV